MGDVLAAHFARKDLEATQFGVSLQRLKPNQRMPFGHQHEQQEEIYVIVGGSGRLRLDDEIVDVASVGRRPRRARRSCGPSRPGPTASTWSPSARRPRPQDSQQEMGWWTD